MKVSDIIEDYRGYEERGDENHNSRDIENQAHWLVYAPAVNTFSPEHLALMEAVYEATAAVGFNYWESGDAFGMWHTDESLEAHRRVRFTLDALAAYRKKHGLESGG